MKFDWIHCRQKNVSRIFCSLTPHVYLPLHSGCNPNLYKIKTMNKTGIQKSMSNLDSNVITQKPFSCIWVADFFIHILVIAIILTRMSHFGTQLRRILRKWWDVTMCKSIGTVLQNVAVKILMTKPIIQKKRSWPFWFLSW